MTTWPELQREVESVKKVNAEIADIMQVDPEVQRVNEQYPDKPVTEGEYRQHLADVKDNEKFHEGILALAVKDVDKLMHDLAQAQMCNFDQLSYEEKLRAKNRQSLIASAWRMYRDQIGPLPDEQS